MLSLALPRLSCGSPQRPVRLSGQIGKDAMNRRKAKIATNTFWILTQLWTQVIDGVIASSLIHVREFSAVQRLNSFNESRQFLLLILDDVAQTVAQITQSCTSLDTSFLGVFEAMSTKIMVWVAGLPHVNGKSVFSLLPPTPSPHTHANPHAKLQPKHTQHTDAQPKHATTVLTSALGGRPKRTIASGTPSATRHCSTTLWCLW